MDMNLTRKHGQSSSSPTHPASREYETWTKMKGRCYNSQNQNFKYYGAKNIQVCVRWMQFENFFADMGKRPGPGYSLDRYPNKNGNYEPGNCRWATAKEQANNRNPMKIRTRKSFCKFGHIFTGTTKYGYQICRTCQSNNQRNYRERRTLTNVNPSL